MPKNRKNSLASCDSSPALQDLSTVRYLQGLCALFLLSLAHLAWQLSEIANPLDHIYSDMHGYVERGWKLTLGMPLTPFDAFFPIGTASFYSLFFSTLGFAKGLQAIVYVQAILIAGANLLIALSTRILLNSRKLALLVFLGASLYWPFISQASFFMAEPLFMFGGMLALYLYCCGLSTDSWQQRGNTAFRRHGVSLCLGMVLGYTSLVKGQGLAIIAGIVVTTFFARNTRGIRWTAISIGIGAVFPLALQCAVHTANLGTPSFFLSANDAYNSYLGQSRREAVGCLDTQNQLFYLFHNNNAGLKYRFLEPEILNVSILDRAYFQRRTRELWQADVRGQLIKSLHNIVELVEVNPRWPQRDVSAMQSLDVESQKYSIFFLILPALYTLVGALLFGRYRFLALLCGTPLLFLGVLITMTMGQPRYMVPFLYFLFPLAAVFYRDLGETLSGSASGNDIVGDPSNV